LLEFKFKFEFYCLKPLFKKMLNLFSFFLNPSHLPAGFACSPARQKSVAAPPSSRLGFSHAARLGPSQPSTVGPAPPAARDASRSRRRRQVGATCHPPPRVVAKPDSSTSPTAPRACPSPWPARHGRALPGLFKARRRPLDLPSKQIAPPSCLAASRRKP
jgi:hypothetical protein